MNQRCIALLAWYGIIVMLGAESLYSSDIGAVRAVSSPTQEKTILFEFQEDPLLDVINFVAAEKGVNIVLPAGTDALAAKVTLACREPLTISQAWNMLATILDVAGYTIVLRGSMYAIVKNSKAIVKEPLPLYVGIAPADLPDTDQRIRYLYYLTNFKLPEEAGGGPSELDVVLQSVLTETATYKTDPKTNAVVIVDKASSIKSYMNLIVALDQTTFRERLEVLKLRYTSAEVIARLFEENILKGTDPHRYGLRDKRPLEEANYFSRQIKLIPEPRTNTLVMVGRQQAVERMKEFILKYIDVELESGQSILHIYQLQYLDADVLAPVLTNILKNQRTGGTGQSAGSESVQSGPERYFEGVIVKTDKPQNVRNEGLSYAGSNKLIIAAKNDDWKVIRPLIESLDKPQRQVIIEVLIVDLTANDARLLGTSLRNPASIPLPKGVDIQTVHVTPQAILDTPAKTTSNLATNLLQDTLIPPTSSGTITNVAALAAPGSTMISLSDPGTGSTWGIMQLLQTFAHSKILSHPHVIATNNRPALVKIGETRLLPGEASPSAAAPIVRNENQAADLTVQITPRISANDTVSLKVEISIVEFIQQNARVTREVQTFAEVKNGSVLSLGGLIRTADEEGANETPVLSKIPVIGWMFKSRKKQLVKNNLTVFISPTIVEPRLRGGVGEYTMEHLTIADTYSKESMSFDNLRDPVTRFFFNNNEGRDLVETFLEKDEFKQSSKDLARYESVREKQIFIEAPIVTMPNDQGQKVYDVHQSVEQEENKPSMMPASQPDIDQDEAIPVATINDDRAAQLKKLLQECDDVVVG